MGMLEYRTNYIIWTLVDVGWTCVDAVFFSLLIQNVGTIGDWSYGEAIAMAGVARLMVVPVWAWMYQSLSKLSGLISEGKLDLVLTKPASSQFLVSTTDFDLNFIPSVVGGIGLTLYGMHLSSIPVQLNNVALLVYLLFISTALMYGMYFSIVAMTLYVGRLNNIHHIFPRLFDAGKFPKEIYSPTLQHIFTIIIPLAIMLVVPVDSLFHPLSWANFVLLHIMAIMFLVLSHLIWTTGLRHYSSASS